MTRLATSRELVCTEGCLPHMTLCPIGEAGWVSDFSGYPLPTWNGLLL